MNLITVLERMDCVDTLLDALVKHDDVFGSHDVIGYLEGWNVRINSRAKGRLGLCNIRKKEIQLSAFITEEEKKDTLLHEMAHAVCYHVFKQCNHGREWKYVMRMLGQQPNRATPSKSLREERIRSAKHIYACEDCGYEWHAQRRWKRVIGRSHVACRHRENRGRLYKKA